MVGNLAEWTLIPSGYTWALGRFITCPFSFDGSYAYTSSGNLDNGVKSLDIVGFRVCMY